MDETKQAVDYAQYWQEVMKLLMNPGGLLCSVDAQGKPNVMAIGWATLGVVWGKPMVVVFVRPTRFTYELIEQVPDFTVNIPSPKMGEVVQHCGTVSGRTHDKFSECKLTLATAQKVKSPVIEECLLHYECQVVHRNDVIPENLTQDIIATCYPQGNFHRIYFGEIVAAYAVRDFLEQIKSLSHI